MTGGWKGRAATSVATLKWARRGLFVAAVLVGALLYCYAISYGLKPRLETSERSYQPEQLARTEALRDTGLDTESPPVVWREADYGEGSAAEWYPKGESPILRELAQQRKIEPVHARTGPEPVVMEGVDGLGSYGGTWMRVANSVLDAGIISWRLAGETLVRYSPHGEPIVPHIAKSWDIEDDNRRYIFHLRRGMRWSDGEPFTADDILYWWNWEAKYFDLIPSIMMVGGEYGEIRKIDDFTVAFEFPHPHALFLRLLPNFPGFKAPEHYFSQYHPEIGDQDLIERALKAAKLTSTFSLYRQLDHWTNTECPRLWPWIYRTYTSNPPWTFVRNPYYWAVDTQGNQLPYIDRIQMDLKPMNLIPMTAASGGISMQERHLRYDSYTLLMSEREANGYEVYHWKPSWASTWVIWPDLNRRVTEDDPSSQWKRKLLNDADFRKALSLALDRERIIKAEYGGVGEPAQLAPGPDSKFFSERLYNSYVDHDPKKAKEILDTIGLDQRDGEGYRTFPDGSRMTWFLSYSFFTGAGPAPLVAEDWRAVGLRVVIRERSRQLFDAERHAHIVDFAVGPGRGEHDPDVMPSNFFPADGTSYNAHRYAIWYARGGLYGNPAATENKYALSPPQDHPVYQNMLTYEEVKMTPDPERRRELIKRILESNAENLWAINISSAPPLLVVVKNDFKNVPRTAIYGGAYHTLANAGLETYYIEDPQDSPGAIAQTQRAMLEVVPPPDSLSEAEREGWSWQGVGKLVRHVLLGIGACLALLVGFKHPYIGRRLVLMVPTLLIISAVSFIIIQLPPGDFVQTRLLELQMMGDDSESARQEIEELTEIFHLDKSMVERYTRWLGLHWFVTFEEADKGLLQGNLGRSMENKQMVNDIVGDRVLLTFLISLGTILFTWATALPMGILSAVRKYTKTDYIVTLIGFVGMSTPNFLLALVLIYISGEYFGINMTGLFSPEFAAQPEWNMAKVIDLLKHIWVPVVVVGTAGTAAMIRVMRSNLLDELKKPYVTTALAKGVRPVKLLIKYPVRIAINPFISGIGGIFPALISGGAIVAMVLSLPTVGPLMLQAFLTEDLYLAGSMLMVFSLLGVLGTLVSDLLLLWLDPRIRMEGRGR